MLNDLLLATAAKYDAQSVLESPSFGFTGISGINLVALADAGLEVTLEDDNTHRLELIRNLLAHSGPLLHRARLIRASASIIPTRPSTSAFPFPPSGSFRT